MSASFQRGKAWSIAVLLAVFMLVNFVDKIVVGLVAVPMMTDLHLSPVEYGVIAGSFFWLFSICGILGGFLANRIKAKWLLLGMAILWSAAQLPIMFSSSVAVFIIARVVLGMSEGPAWPVGVHACYKWFPDDKRNLPVSVMAQGSASGLLIAALTIPHITAHWGWRANFMVLGVIGIVWCVLWLLFGAEGTIDDKASERHDVSVPQHRVRYARLLTDRTVLSNFVMYFVAYWGLSLALTWLPAFLEKGLGYSNIAAGHMYALAVLVTVPLGIGLSWWSQRLLTKGVSSRAARAVFASICLIIAGLLYCALLVFNLSAFQKVILMAVAGGTSPIMYSLGPAMIGEVTPASQRGAILAIENSIGAFAGVLAPLAAGKLVEMTAGPIGYEHAFVLSGVLLICGGLVGLLWMNPEKSAQRLSAPDVPARVQPAV